MSVRLQNNPVMTKAVVTVAEMSRMLGFSRSRFYQLQREEIFPPPVYDVRTRRPCYTEEQQQICLEVRRRNCGINGVPVLFYARRLNIDASSPRPRPAAARAASRPHPSQHVGLIESLSSLGLSSVKPQQVESAIRVCFPNGIGDTDEGLVVRSLFRFLRQSQRQNSTDNLNT